MHTFIRFLYEFMSVFFRGIGIILKGFVSGIMQMFNISEYIYLIQFYKKDFAIGEWLLVIIAIIILVIMLSLIILLLYFIIRKYIRFRKTLVEQESMLEEIAKLNNEVKQLVEDKEKILAMKVSQLGLKPGEEAEISSEEDTGKKDDNTEEGIANLENVRFSK